MKQVIAISAALLAVVNAAPCAPAVGSSLVTKLMGVQSVMPCIQQTTILQDKALPSDDKIAEYCLLATCKTAFTDLKAIDLPDCEYMGFNPRSLKSKVTDICDKATSSGTKGSAPTAPVDTPAAPAAPADSPAAPADSPVEKPVASASHRGAVVDADKGHKHDEYKTAKC